MLCSSGEQLVSRSMCNPCSAPRWKKDLPSVFWFLYRFCFFRRQDEAAKDLEPVCSAEGVGVAGGGQGTSLPGDARCVTWPFALQREHRLQTWSTWRPGLTWGKKTCKRRRGNMLQDKRINLKDGWINQELLNRLEKREFWRKITKSFVHLLLRWRAVFLCALPSQAEQQHPDSS